jgi:hypothetical protein
LEGAGEKGLEPLQSIEQIPASADSQNDKHNPNDILYPQEENENREGKELPGQDDEHIENPVMPFHDQTFS